MRGIFVLVIGLAIAFWLDQTYYGGAYSRPVVELVREIAASLR